MAPGNKIILCFFALIVVSCNGISRRYFYYTQDTAHCSIRCSYIEYTDTVLSNSLSDIADSLDECDFIVIKHLAKTVPYSCASDSPYNIIVSTFHKNYTNDAMEVFVDGRYYTMLNDKLCIILDSDGVAETYGKVNPAMWKHVKFTKTSGWITPLEELRKVYYDPGESKIIVY